MLDCMDTPILPQTDHQAASGARLAEVIHRLGITKVEAARIMGISKHVLRNWIVGENPIQPYAVYRLNRVKGIDFNYVFLNDWSRLPHTMAQAIEAEVLAKLAASSEAEPLATEKTDA